MTPPHAPSPQVGNQEATSSECAPSVHILVTDQRQRDDTTHGESPLKHVSEIAKAVAWPLIVVFSMLWLREPLFKIAEVLPEKIRSAEKLSIFAVTLEEKAAAEGEPRIANAINSLSPKAIEKFLEIGRDNHIALVQREPDADAYALPPEKELLALQELEAQDLVEAAYSDGRTEEPMRLTDIVGVLSRQHNVRRIRVGNDYQTLIYPLPELIPKLQRYRYQLTEFGRKALDAISAAIAEQLRVPRRDRP